MNEEIITLELGDGQLFDFAKYFGVGKKLSDAAIFRIITLMRKDAKNHGIKNSDYVCYFEDWSKDFEQYKSIDDVACKYMPMIPITIARAMIIEHFTLHNLPDGMVLLDTFDLV